MADLGSGLHNGRSDWHLRLLLRRGGGKEYGEFVERDRLALAELFLGHVATKKAKWGHSSSAIAQPKICDSLFGLESVSR